MTTTTRQGADLTAHLTYFDPSTQASFVWDGKSSEIEVSIGGYGEPVDHDIPAPVLGNGFEADMLFEVFESLVREHVATLETFG